MRIYRAHTLQVPELAGLPVCEMRSEWQYRRRNDAEITCLNIERFKLDERKDDPADVYERLEKLAAIIDKHRRVKPDRLFGFYSYMPIRDFWTPVSGGVGAKKEWEIASELVAYYLAENVHVAMPSLYTFYTLDSRENVEQWKVYASENIRLARLQCLKPVIPFLWPRYHQTNPDGLGYQPLSREAFVMQLQHLRSLNVDGVVIWDANKYFARKGHPDWSWSDGWVQGLAGQLGQRRMMGR